MFYLKPPRHISTLPFPEVAVGWSYFRLSQERTLVVPLGTSVSCHKQIGRLHSISDDEALLAVRLLLVAPGIRLSNTSTSTIPTA